MTITVNFQSSRIQVSADQAALDVSALYEAIKDAQDSEQGIMYSPIAAGAGKFDLGGGRSSGLVVRLNTPWQIEFLGSGQRTIDGGILVGGLGNQPVYFTTNIQVIMNRPADAFIVSTGSEGSTGTGGGTVGDVVIDTVAIFDTVKKAIQSELNRIYVPSSGGTNAGPVSATLVHSQNNVSLVQLPGSGNLVNNLTSSPRNPF